jgi:hypothetical protein
VTLAAIGANYHWPRADLEALTAGELRFWAAAMAEFIKRVQAQAQK